jgi:hypothetical protein
MYYEIVAQISIWFHKLYYPLADWLGVSGIPVRSAGRE